ncbi:hypothetical protein T07_9189 [Trichinella nelsoni]|uniref:Uncharacterized protein n=1 Tax=Trichinella nelsoni TaxID=6336 RepID=A0A0V0RGG8_9BILA|nr:hypothetical protein T07_9189 [Trichinella nelsoni]
MRSAYLRVRIQGSSTHRKLEKIELNITKPYFCVYCKRLILEHLIEISFPLGVAGTDRIEKFTLQMIFLRQLMFRSFGPVLAMLLMQCKISFYGLHLKRKYSIRGFQVTNLFCNPKCVNMLIRCRTLTLLRFAFVGQLPLISCRFLKEL